MLGGGTFTAQDKILPGAYINVVSASRAGSAVDNGIVAMPFPLSWGVVGKVARITQEEFEKDSLRLLGYKKDAEEMRPFREIFRNASVLYFYRLNQNPVKASNDYAEARYAGLRGNAIKVVIQKNVDDESKFDVKTLIDGAVYEIQTVDTSASLVDNSFLSFKKSAALAETAGAPLAGGTDGSAVTGELYQAFLDRIETYTFNCLGCPTKDEAVIGLFTAFTKRIRDELGVKIQTIVYKAVNADYEGIISVDNKAEGLEHGLVYWTTGASAACALNRSNTNRVYDGEYAVATPHTQGQLADAIKAGKFVFHKVGDTIRVLRDINTLVTFTDEKNSDFSDNQTIRTLDAIGNNVAGIFSEKYMGQIPNDDAGRVSLWSDIITYMKSLVDARAVEPFETNTATVYKGETKRSVVTELPVTPINCMEQMYMRVVVQ